MYADLGPGDAVVLRGLPKSHLLWLRRALEAEAQPGYDATVRTSSEEMGLLCPRSGVCVWSAINQRSCGGAKTRDVEETGTRRYVGVGYWDAACCGTGARCKRRELLQAL